MKSALIHPIPKKGDGSDPSNYRLDLVDHRLINDRQYGFRHNRWFSSLPNPPELRLLKAKKEGLTVSLDMAKAFERVWHGALLAKLPFYGLSENLCKWIASFLTGRSIKVAIDGFCFEYMPVNAGVPQGCVLSPTLFLLHINVRGFWHPLLCRW